MQTLLSATGYDETNSESIVKEAIEIDGTITQLVLESTPFYAAAGGQVTDIGRVENLTQEGSASVAGVRKDDSGIYVHTVEQVSGDFVAGDRCQLLVDLDRRNRIVRNHTATHLLHAGLREILGNHVAQAGSLVNDVELRFD